MAIQRATRKRADTYLDELQNLILERFPEAEFEIRRQDAREYDLLVYGNFSDSTELDEVIEDRPTDILLESGIHIHVLALGPRISSS
jgi:hypothetical protein